MVRRSIFKAAVFILLSIFSACDKNEGPTDLTLSVTVSTDGSGMVYMVASAKNAAYYEYFFGDVQDEVATRSSLGQAAHDYGETGQYTVTVLAIGKDESSISASNTFDVEVFIDIPQTGYTTPENYAGMSKIWSEEFNGAVLNESDWKFEIGDGCPNVCGWGNNELEFYQKGNTSLTGGFLVIEARRESVGGKNYTSSRIVTKDKFTFTYGRVDVRALLPKGQGIWPAIWLLGSNIDAVSWPKCGEIDVMEMIGGSGREKTVHGTAHWDHSGSYANYSGNYSLTNGIFSDEFHVFSIVWDNSKITWYTDDVKYHEIDITPPALSEFHNNFFFILNVAVGGNWPGNPDTSTQMPQRMIVDYIRVFQ